MALTNQEKHRRWRERHPEKYREKGEISNARRRSKTVLATGQYYAVELIDPSDDRTKAVFVAHHKDSPRWKVLLELPADSSIRQWLENTQPIAAPVDGFGVALPKVAAEWMVKRRIKELKGNLLYPEKKKRVKRAHTHKRPKTSQTIRRISEYRPDR